MFLGYEIDTVEMVIRVPTEKLSELMERLCSVLHSQNVTRSDLESLVGSLSFCGKAIVPGRAFLRRFYDLLMSVKEKHHHIRISQKTKADISMWLDFLSEFNGRAHIPSSVWEDSETRCLFTDSAGSHHLGCGSYFAGSWVYYQWPDNWAGQIIMENLRLLEFVPVVLALLLWGHRLANRRVKFRVDNLALVSILNT